MKKNMSCRAVALLAVGFAITLFCSCNHYDDFEIVGKVVEQEYCTNLQNRGYVVALTSPDGVGGKYTCANGTSYDNVVVVYKADRIIKKNATISGRIYIDNNFSASECSYHYDRDCPEAVFTKLKIE